MSRRALIARNLRSVAGIIVTGLILTGLLGSPSTAQQIVSPTAPAANLPGIGKSSSGVPTINIAPPNAGLSHNKFQQFDVGAGGVILNNSATSGTSRIGGTVAGNPKLSATGAASTILNEVTGTAASSLKGTTEVFGTRADVILANPNGITCTGCSFINTGRASLVTAAPTVANGKAQFTVSKGTLTVSGAKALEGSLDLVGRHVIIGADGVTAQGSLLVSGGSQVFDHATGSVRAAPIVSTRQVPFAVDGTSYGAMQAGQIRIHGNEAGLGVATYGAAKATGAGAAGSVAISSLDSLYYFDASGAGSAKITATGLAKQQGNAVFGQNVSIAAGDYYLSRDAKITAGGDVTLNVTNTATIYGEISGKNISVKTGKGLNNYGFLLASGNLEIAAGDAVQNQREKLVEYNITYDAGQLPYIALYQSWAPRTDWYGTYARQMLANLEKRVVVDEDVAKGGTFTGTTINLTAATDLLNYGSVIASTGDLSINAGGKVWSTYVLLNKGAQGGASAHKEFYGTAILSGGNLSLKAGGELTNQASSIAAYGDIAIEVKGAVKNYLTADKYVQTEHERLTGTETGSSAGVTTTVAGTLTKTDTWKATWTTTQWLDQYKEDEQLALSPGYIASLTGDLSLKAASYFAVGSDLSARKTLTLDIGGAVTLVEVADTLKQREVIDIGSTTSTTRTSTLNTKGKETYSYSCGWFGWSRCSATRNVNTTTTSTTTAITGSESQKSDVTTNLTIVEASDLVGRDIDIKAGSLNAPGAKILAQDSLSLKTRTSLLLDSGAAKADAATIAATGGYAGWDALAATTLAPNAIKVLDLGTDALAAIKSKATAESYEAFLEDQAHMQAVQALHYLSATDLRPVARRVGVQSWKLATSKTGFTYVDAASVVEGKHTFIDALNAAFATRALPSTLATVSLLDKTDWAEELTGFTAKNAAIADIEADLLGADWNTAKLRAVANDELVRALGWRYATSAGLEKLNATSNTLLFAAGDLSLASDGDVGIKGGTVVASGGNLRVEAGQDIVLLGLNGAGIAANQATASSTGSAGFYDPTALARALVSAGDNLTLIAKRDIWNVGSSISSVGDLSATAGGNIQNQAIGTTFTQTAETGCLNAACGTNGKTFTPAEMLSGFGLLLTAKSDIVNRGSVMSAFASAELTAGRDVVNDSRAATYESNSLDIENRAPWWLGGWCIECVHTHEFTGVVQGGNISTAMGSVVVDAKRDIRNVGATLSSSSRIDLTAGQDILLDAQSIEVQNQNKSTGFCGWFCYGGEKTRWNNFTTQLSQLEAGEISARAKRHLTGIGAILISQTDIDLVAEAGTITFDAEQNQKYLSQSGWSLGGSFKGMDILEALASQGGKAAFQKYVASNPMLAAVSKLAENKGRGVNEWINLGLTTSRTLAAVKPIAGSDGSWTGTTQAGLINALAGDFAKQFNPFPNPGDVASGCKQASLDCMFALGVSFRYAAWTSEKTWTESHVSKVLAGQDLSLAAGKDIALVGGTIASAGRNLYLSAGNDLIVTALADTSRSKSSNWGASLGFSGGGITVGGNYFTSSQASTLYTNASVTAVGDVSAASGRDMRLLGANVGANNIFLNTGRDLTVASRQNSSNGNSWGFDFSVTFTGGAPTAGTIGGSLGQSNRLYTDTPTTIIAAQTLDAYVGNTTFLLGAMLNSKAGKLKLDTGNFVFDHYGDKDYERNIAVSLSIDPTNLKNSDANGSYFYRNKTGVTYATVGAGTINVRNKPAAGTPGTSLLALNRDAANLQRVVKDEVIDIKIPTVNIAKVIEDLTKSINLVRAIGATVPAHIAKLGPNGEALFRAMIMNGASFEDAEKRSREKSFSVEANSMAFAMEKAKRGQMPTAEEQAALLSGYALVMDGITGKTALVVPCPTMGVCTMLLEEFLKNVSDKKEFILAALANPSAWDFTKSEFTAIKAQFRMLLLCAATEPDVYNKFIADAANREIANKFLAYYNIDSDKDLLNALKDTENARLIFQAAFGRPTYVLTDFGLKVNGAIYATKVAIEFHEALLSDDPAIRAAAEKQRDAFFKGLGEAASYCNEHAAECAKEFGTGVANSLSDMWKRIKSGDAAAISDAVLEVGTALVPILKSGKILTVLEAAQQMTIRRAAELVLKTCTHSFAQGTPVLMADGTYRPISSLKIGDLVASRSEFTQINSVRPITATFINPHTDRVVLTLASERGDEVITTTMEHPFWVAGHGFTNAGSLRAGQRVAAFQAANPLLAVSSRENDTSGALLVKAVQAEASGAGDWLAWNLTVEADHTFFVGTSNAWVHNVHCFTELIDFAAATPSGSGRITATVFNVRGSVVEGLTDAQKIAATDISKLGDALGTATEQLVEDVAANKGLKSLPGGKYGSNNGFDHVFVDESGNTVILLDSKQLNKSGATKLNPNAAGDTMQMSNDWVKAVLGNLADSPAKTAVAAALENGTLVKGVVGVSKKTSDLVIVRVQ